jgi:hypothetical protein
MAKSLEDVAAELGWHELKPLPPEERDRLVAELLFEPEIRACAEACVSKGATMDTLASVVEPILCTKRPSVDGYQFFDLVAEIAKRVRDGG